MKKKILIYCVLAVVFLASIFIIYSSNKDLNDIKIEQNVMTEEYVQNNYKITIDSTLSNNIIYYNVNKEYIGKDKITKSDIKIEVICYYNLKGDVENDVYNQLLTLTSDLTPGTINIEDGTVGNYNISYMIKSVEGTYK